MNKADITLALAGLTLAVASISAAPAAAQTNLSFATAANFGISGNFGYPDGAGAIGQTYYYKFLDVFPANVGIGFVPHDLQDWATGPLTLYSSSYASIPSTSPYGDFYTLVPGLYYVSFYETTIGYLRATGGQPTTDFSLEIEGNPVGPTTLPVPPGYYSQTVIEDVPPGYVVPEVSSAWLLLAGLLPVGLAATRRRRVA